MYGSQLLKKQTAGLPGENMDAFQRSTTENAAQQRKERGKKKENFFKRVVFFLIAFLCSIPHSPILVHIVLRLRDISITLQ